MSEETQPKRGRRSRTNKQLFYDQFADFNVADQSTVLEFLAELHRQKKRDAARSKPETNSQEKLPL